jgi:hypothetical protein
MLSLADEILTPDFVLHNPVLPSDFIKRSRRCKDSSGVVDNLPGHQFTHHETISKADKVLIQWTLTGIPKGVSASEIQNTRKLSKLWQVQTWMFLIRYANCGRRSQSHLAYLEIKYAAMNSSFFGGDIGNAYIAVIDVQIDKWQLLYSNILPPT